MTGKIPIGEHGPAFETASHNSTGVLAGGVGFHVNEVYMRYGPGPLVALLKVKGIPQARCLPLIHHLGPDRSPNAVGN